MGHKALGLFVPNRIVKAGAVLVADLADRLLLPLHQQYAVPPYRRYFTPEEVNALAAEHRLDPTDLRRLAGAIAASRGMLEAEVVQIRGSVLAHQVRHIGVTRDGRLFCVSTENQGFRLDWYDIGGRFYGELTGTEYEGEFPWWHFELPEKRQVHDNIAPVETALARIKGTGSPVFQAFLTPRGKWYDMPAGRSDDLPRQKS